MRVGDRVIYTHGRHYGTVVALGEVTKMVFVEWDDGHESTWNRHDEVKPIVRVKGLIS